MKLRLVNTITGLVPFSDEDYEAKRRLKNGRVYEATIKEARNYKFHCKFFSLLNIAWEYLSEDSQKFFHDNQDKFRETLLIATGHTETFYDIGRKEWLERAKSMAFDKMDESEFEDFYNKAKDVIYNTFIPEESKDEFQQQLRFF